MVRQSKLDIESYINHLAEIVLAETEPTVESESSSLESVLTGLALELWSDAAGSLFIVADEDDTRRLGEPRGTVYTAAEMRQVVQIRDPAIVLEVHEWKRMFNGRVRAYQNALKGEGRAQLPLVITTAKPGAQNTPDSRPGWSRGPTAGNRNAAGMNSLPALRSVCAEEAVQPARRQPTGR
jgi:hypothetical protein